MATCTATEVGLGEQVRNVGAWTGGSRREKAGSGCLPGGNAKGFGDGLDVKKKSKPPIFDLSKGGHAIS